MFFTYNSILKKLTFKAIKTKFYYDQAIGAYCACGCFQLDLGLNESIYANTTCRRHVFYYPHKVNGNAPKKLRFDECD